MLTTAIPDCAIKYRGLVKSTTIPYVVRSTIGYHISNSWDSCFLMHTWIWNNHSIRPAYRY